MHPIERLRWIARAEDEPVSAVAIEAALTLAELVRDEPAAALMAARRLVEHHPSAGPIYWACARVLAADDPLSEASAVSRALSLDETARHLSSLLKEGLGAGSVLVTSAPCQVLEEALCLDPGGYVIRVVAEPQSLRHDVRSFGRVADEAIGYRPDECREALFGAAALVVEALAAGPAAVLTRPPAAALVDGAAAAGVPALLLVAEGRALPPPLAAAAARAAVTAGVAEVVPPGRFSSAVGRSGAGDAASLVSSVTCPPGDWLAANRR